jgi:DNA polymerase-3 subunit epsilon
MFKLAFYDLETTGLDKEKDKITEIALKYYNLKTGEKDIFHRYIKYKSYPKDYDKIAEKTGLTIEFLEEKGVPENEAYIDFEIFLNDKVDKFDSKDKIITAGFNICSFDDQFIRSIFKRFFEHSYGNYISFLKIDLMSLLGVANILGIIPKLKNDKLETYKEHFKIDAKSHSAIEDVGTTEKLFYKMMVEIFVNFKSDEKRLKKIIE